MSFIFGAIIGLAIGWFLLPRPLWVGDLVSDLKYKWRNRNAD